jgi:hypothetical protein
VSENVLQIVTVGDMPIQHQSFGTMLLFNFYLLFLLHQQTDTVEIGGWCVCSLFARTVLFIHWEMICSLQGPVRASGHWPFTGSICVWVLRFERLAMQILH